MKLSQFDHESGRKAGEHLTDYDADALYYKIHC